MYDWSLYVSNKIYFRLLLSFNRIQENKIHNSLLIFDNLFKKHIPDLYDHLVLTLEVPLETCLYKWFFTIFSDSLKIDVVLIVWDFLLTFEFEVVVFKTAIIILQNLKNSLLEHNDPASVLDFIKKQSKLLISKDMVLNGLRSSFIDEVELKLKLNEKGDNID